MQRRDRYEPIPEIDEPAQFRTARGTHDGVRSSVEPRYPRSVPGSQDRATAYANSVLQPAGQRQYRHLNAKNRLTGLILSGVVLMGVGAVADRLEQTSNRSYDAAAEVDRSAHDAAQAITEKGSNGIVLVPLTVGDSIPAVADRISNQSSFEEVAQILQDQQATPTSPQSSDVISNSVAALPRADLTAAEISSLPDGGQVTPLGLVALQNGGNSTVVPVAQDNIQ